MRCTDHRTGCFLVGRAGGIQLRAIDSQLLLADDDMKTAVAAVAVVAVLIVLIRMPVEDSTKETMALIDASRNAHLRLFC